MDDEHEEYAENFDLYIARILGDLYRQRGRRVDLEAQALSGKDEASDTDPCFEAANNAISWLNEFGYIKGNEAYGGGGVCGDFVITPLGMAVLNRPPARLSFRNPR